MSNLQAFACALAVAAFVFAMNWGLSSQIKSQEQTKIEAIKAGLVQDKDGHWVKP